VTILDADPILAIVRYRDPAAFGGPDHPRALRGPFSRVAFLPTGAIGPEDVGSWFDAGAACAGLGGMLVGATPPETDPRARGTAERLRGAIDRARAVLGRKTA
jgi:2-dehydro-3-deoxyphosphogluconate aldolase / (4S)-4-hydroxy-2-oxoglutarate aldolase